MNISVHVPGKNGPIGQLDAEPGQVWFRSGEGYLSGKPCYEVRDLLGRGFIAIPFSMAFDDGQILTSCRITTNRGPSSRFTYDLLAAGGPAVRQ
jgi:hypothetical protein